MTEGRTRGGLLSRLVRRLVGAEPARAEPPAPPSADDDDDRLVDEEFRLAIDSLSHDQEGRFQTRLQIISLVEFREAVGERWYRVAAKVMMIAEGVINVHIGAGNLFTRQGQDFFVLVFRNCSQLEGRRRALAIAQDLGTRLLGDQFIGLERPLALAAELTLAAAVNSDGTFNMAAIHTAIGEMRAFLAEESGKAAPRRALMPGHGGGESGGLRRSLMPSDPPAADAGLRHSLLPSRLPPPEPTPLPERPPITGVPSAVARPEGPGPDPEWRPIKTRRRHYRHGEGPQPAEPEPAAARLSLLWRPTWLASAEAIALYKVQVQRGGPDGGPPLEGSRAYAPGGADAAMLDRAVIAGAASELAKGGDASLILPLHWASVSSAGRTALAAPLAGGGGDPGRVLIELFGVPADVPPRTVAEAVRAARGLGREVMLRVRLSAPRAVMAADCGFTGIGIDLAELAPSERTDDQGLLDELAHLKDTAERARLGCYVWGVRRRRVVVGAVQGGFAMVNGPALMKDLTRPGRVLPAAKARFTLPG